MDKIKLSNEDIGFILKWRDEHKDLVRFGASPMKAIKIECVDSGYTITGIRDGVELRLTVSEKGSSLGGMVFEALPSGLFALKKDKTKLREEDRQAVLTVYCSVMALFVFGNDTVDMPQQKERKKEESHHKSKKTRKKVKCKGATYILGIRGNEPKMMVKGSHSSPSGTFSVRGHYRHYKSGKVVWIAEFTKGSGKKKDKTYKVGGKDYGRSEKMD